MPARIDDLLVLNQHISKTELGKYLRDREAVLPADFGGLGGGGVADDRAAADGKMAVIPPGTWNVSAGVTLGGGARGLIMRGVLRYTGTAPATVLTLGDGGTTRNGEKLYANLQVVRQTQSDWGSEADIGILARNLDASVLDVRLVQGFTIGLRTLGDGRGFEDSTLYLHRFLNNRIGLDIRCAAATAGTPRSAGGVRRRAGRAPATANGPASALAQVTGAKLGFTNSVETVRTIRLDRKSKVQTPAFAAPPARSPCASPTPGC